MERDYDNNSTSERQDTYAESHGTFDVLAYVLVIRINLPS